MRGHDRRAVAAPEPKKTIPSWIRQDMLKDEFRKQQQQQREAALASKQAARDTAKRLPMTGYADVASDVEDSAARSCAYRAAFIRHRTSSRARPKQTRSARPLWLAPCKY